MQINTNILSMNAGRGLLRAASDVGVSMARLSSGMRINTARDDAAGLAIAERMTAGVRGMNRAAQNANDGISLVQVADGAAGRLADNFQRIRELAVQAANGTYTGGDRKAIQREADELMKSNFDIVTGTRFNNLNILDGTFREDFQIGEQAGQTISLAIPAALPINVTSLQLKDVPLKRVNAVGNVQGALAQGSLVLNGTAVGASVTGAEPGQTSLSAYAVARAINQASPAGFTATAENDTSGTVGGAGGVANGGLLINGVGVGAFSGLTGAAYAAAAAAAISGAAGATGVTASASGTTLTLTAVDGRDISIGDTSGGAAIGSLGLTGGTTRGTVTINNAEDVEPDSLVISGNNPGLAGFAPGTVAPEETGNTVSLLRPVGSGDPPLDLSTAASASAMLDYIDAKLETVNGMRSMLGAAENRLMHAHDNLVNGALNLSAARSRIRDTDYAAETMQLTRGQILQQAATAMVAQANAIPSQALALLRG
ncbi:flagellin N-terminal helical domain-containing protein [Pseudoduganella namucuonensis]|uniref:Flagellin n=1 Tax=Pseudoduganella namucuonensis TaxID=1035707 RepID=A0A1I7M152_9BURK|nr:flagellin [Pseudoduganella namucuonensis]SFV15629.1 flagellin [Pseudoduganella namucuonensis]